jgi:hypothetical protein
MLSFLNKEQRQGTSFFPFKNNIGNCKMQERLDVISFLNIPKVFFYFIEVGRGRGARGLLKKRGRDRKVLKNLFQTKN